MFVRPVIYEKKGEVLRVAKHDNEETELVAEEQIELISQLMLSIHEK